LLFSEMALPRGWSQFKQANQIREAGYRYVWHESKVTDRRNALRRLADKIR
jgi:hypothetical protein